MDEGHGYVNTVNGRERVAGPGRWPDWSGWSLVRASDLRDGFHVRLGGRQFAAQVEDPGTNIVRVREGERRPPFIIWKGCLVWTYLGS